MIGIGKKESQPNKLLPGVCVEGGTRQGTKYLLTAFCMERYFAHPQAATLQGHYPWAFVAKIDEPFATFHSP